MPFSPEPALNSTDWYQWATDVHNICTVTVPDLLNRVATLENQVATLQTQITAKADLDSTNKLNKQQMPTVDQLAFTDTSTLSSTALQITGGRFNKVDL